MNVGAGNASIMGVGSRVVKLSRKSEMKLSLGRVEKRLETGSKRRGADETKGM